MWYHYHMQILRLSIKIAIILFLLPMTVSIVSLHALMKEEPSAAYTIMGNALALLGLYLHIAKPSAIMPLYNKS